STLIDHAIAYYTGYIKVGTYDNGAISDFNRWGDCAPSCPRSMWHHTEGAGSALIAVADMYARSGHTSLYTLTAPTQVIGGNGGTVGLNKIVHLLADMANKTVTLYGTTDGTE